MNSVALISLLLLLPFNIQAKNEIKKCRSNKVSISCSTVPGALRPGFCSKKKDLKMKTINTLCTMKDLKQTKGTSTKENLKDIKIKS